LQADLVVFGVTVTASINSSLDDVRAALKGSGAAIANLSGVNGVFAVGGPFVQMQATVASLTSLPRSIIQANRGFPFWFEFDACFSAQDT
jgi:hypothetical protein